MSERTKSSFRINGAEHSLASAYMRVEEGGGEHEVLVHLMESRDAFVITTFHDISDTGRTFVKMIHSEGGMMLLEMHHHTLIGTMGFVMSGDDLAKPISDNMTDMYRLGYMLICGVSELKQKKYQLKLNISQVEAHKWFHEARENVMWRNDLTEQGGLLTYSEVIGEWMAY